MLANGDTSRGSVTARMCGRDLETPRRTRECRGDEDQVLLIQYSLRLTPRIDRGRRPMLPLSRDTKQFAAQSKRK
jgi:hypothetical protein